VYNNIVEIPPSLVLKRWTVSAKDGIVSCIPGDVEVAARQADEACMHGLLHASVMELVSMGVTSRRAFELAVDYVSHAKAAIAAITVNEPGGAPLDSQNVEAAGGEFLQFDPSVAAPPRVRSRGRPKELRFKSPIESPGSRKRPAASAAVPQDTGDRTRKSTRFLKKGVYVMEHCGTCDSAQHHSSACPLNVVPGPSGAAARRCKTCNAVGHNRSTCGRKSSYVAK
jgi:hypothetical protein